MLNPVFLAIVELGYYFDLWTGLVFMYVDDSKRGGESFLKLWRLFHGLLSKQLSQQLLLPPAGAERAG